MSGQSFGKWFDTVKEGRTAGTPAGASASAGGGVAAGAPAGGQGSAWWPWGKTPMQPVAGEAEGASLLPTFMRRAPQQQPSGLASHMPALSRCAGCRC